MRATLSLRTWRHRPVLIAAGILVPALALLAVGPKAQTDKEPVAKPQDPPSATVMVAARMLQAGTVIATADMRAQTIAGSAPEGAIGSLDGGLGRITNKSVREGDVLLKDSLRDPQEVGIAARVPQGERAFAMRVAEDDIVGGLLQSGDHVDIVATIPGSAFSAKDAQLQSDRSRAVLLLQNVLVLAVGENSATRGSIQSGARTVSLSLQPNDLARLTLALRFGKVSLAIRRPDDSAVSDKIIATLDDLTGREDPPQVAPRPVIARNPGVPFYSGERVTIARQDGRP